MPASGLQTVFSTTQSDRSMPHNARVESLSVLDKDPAPALLLLT